MVTQKWKRREDKLRKKRTGMRVTGRSIFTLQEIQKKKADQAKKKNSKPKRKIKKK